MHKIDQLSVTYLEALNLHHSVGKWIKFFIDDFKIWNVDL
jgi:hypothetical protein